ncbi:MAG: hypothetical protein N3B21_12205 [Clostridia bacterium]|nr:hypothetical protein [Clostridia bacterium]
MKKSGPELLKETIRFLEVCQDYVLNGKADVHSYNTLAGLKLSFISYAIKSNDADLPIDSDTRDRINGVMINDHFISTMCKKVVCK